MKSLPMLESERFLPSIRWRQLFDMDEQIQVRIARLESDVHHIQTDVADIKVDLRRSNDKLDAMSLRISGGEEKLTAKIDSVEEKLTGKIDGVEEKLTAKIDGMDEKLTGKIEGVRTELGEAINDLRREIASMKVWAMGMYFALAGSLLFVMAKGFKWI